MPTPDYSNLDPTNPDDRRIIAEEWRKLQARLERRRVRRGWIRVAVVFVTYLLIGLGVSLAIYLLGIALVALFAATN